MNQVDPAEVRKLVTQALGDLSALTTKVSKGPKDATVFDETALPAFERLFETLCKLDDAVPDVSRSAPSLRGVKHKKLFEAHPDAHILLQFLQQSKGATPEQIQSHTEVPQKQLTPTLRSLEGENLCQRKGRQFQITELGQLLLERLDSQKPTAQEIALEITPLGAFILQLACAQDKGISSSDLVSHLATSLSEGKNVHILRRLGLLAFHRSTTDLMYVATPLGREVLPFLKELPPPSATPRPPPRWRRF